MKILKRILFLLISLLLLTTIGIGVYLNSKKPQYSNNLELKILDAQVDVLFDDKGIPHIYAQSEEDAYTALGYVHAQERLFQMELIRRLASGRLAEVFGEAALPSDRFFRTLSFREHIKKSIAEIYTDPADPTVAAAKAYVRGINKYILEGKTPLEYEIAGIEKTQFSLEDCLLTGAYMGFSFSEAFKTDPLMSYIHETYGADYLQDLMNNWELDAAKIPTFDGQSTAAKTMLSISSTIENIRKSNDFIPPFHGSNAWIVSPNRSKNKQVLFENDTHIAFGQPSVFFEASLSYPNHNIYGNFLAGFPFAVIGHNDQGAWGLTMLENDDVDFYKEAYNPLNTNQLKFKNGFVDIENRIERIDIKGGKSEELIVKKTHHGYLINDVCKELDAQKQTPISLWWSYYQFPDHIMHAAYQFSQAKNVAEISHAASLISTPGLNIMWGDKNGDIAWFAAAKIPKRPKNTIPYMMLDGVSGKDEIEGWYGFEENPRCVNPPSGYVYSANNQPDTYKNTALLSGYFCAKDRAERIEHYMKSSKNDFSESDFQKITLDDTSTVQANLAQLIATQLDGKCNDNAEKIGLDFLKNWKGGHGVAAVEPVVYYRTLYFLIKNTFGDELKGDAFEHFMESAVVLKTLPVILKNPNSKWWDNLETHDKKESESEILLKSYQEAMAALKTQLGDNPTAWTWGKVHTLTHKHPLGVMPLVGKYWNVGPFPVAGGKETINNLDLEFDKDGVYNVPFGAALRRVLDFSDIYHAKSINPTGNSGNIMSPYYKNQAEDFAYGRFRLELMLREDVEKVKIGALILK